MGGIAGNYPFRVVQICELRYSDGEKASHSKRRFGESTFSVGFCSPTAVARPSGVVGCI